MTVSAPKSVILGDALTVSIPYERDITRVSVALTNTSGVVVSGVRAFPFPSIAKPTSWIAIMGIPTTIAPGGYDLRTTVDSGGRISGESAEIEVVSRSFYHEDINLDQDLTDLQTEQTELKKQQAEELWHILTSFQPDSVYQTRPFIVPVSKYIVTSPFAERRLFVFAHGGNEASIHQGIDLAVPAGTPVEASGAGRVVFAGSWIMTGNSVVIEHLPGVYSLYFHMERLLVKVGQEVKQAEPIGLVGETGLATGPHLHWQIEIGGVAVDPMSLVKTGLIEQTTGAATGE